MVRLGSGVYVSRLKDGKKLRLDLQKCEAWGGIRDWDPAWEGSYVTTLYRTPGRKWILGTEWLSCGLLEPGEWPPINQYDEITFEDAVHWFDCSHVKMSDEPDLLGDAVKDLKDQGRLSLVNFIDLMRETSSVSTYDIARNVLGKLDCADAEVVSLVRETNESLLRLGLPRVFLVKSNGRDPDVDFSCGDDLSVEWTLAGDAFRKAATRSDLALEDGSKRSYEVPPEILVALEALDIDAAPDEDESPPTPEETEPREDSPSPVGPADSADNSAAPSGNRAKPGGPVWKTGQTNPNPLQADSIVVDRPNLRLKFDHNEVSLPLELFEPLAKLVECADSPIPAAKLGIDPSRFRHLIRTFASEFRDYLGSKRGPRKGGYMIRAPRQPVQFLSAV